MECIRVVAITGAGAGLGRHLALLFADNGWRVAAAELDSSRGVTLATELRALGNDHSVDTVDVRDEASVVSFFENVRSRHGRLDVLINNAAIVPHFNWGYTRWPALSDMPYDFWCDVVGTNLHGIFLCSKYAVPLLESTAGRIVNVSGGLGDPKPGHLAYAVSKHAGVALTRHLAEEVRASGVAVVVVDPGGSFATAEAPSSAHDALPGPETLDQLFFLAAEADLLLSGLLVTVVDGELVAAGLSRLLGEAAAQRVPH